MPDSTSTPSTATPEAAAARPRPSVRFSARDLVSVAIFAVIYFVVIFAISMLGVISPLVMLLTLPLSAIAAGVPYMLFLARVRHAGMLTLFGVALGLLDLMIGHPWQGVLVIIAASVLADLILGVGRYRSTRAAIWAYTVFSCWFIGPWIPFFANPEDYVRSDHMAGMGEDYIEAFDRIVSAPTVLGMVAATIVCGFLGALLGTKLLRKHFRRAGLA
ncbi:MptD family putative ECF transporter S component [Brachybacterium tyrofermentans]|uniref:MptD family putative ECF transporter S component n=1 Tax=Brachybacterium tyrofermentans TaxID=47848 RepID=UPI003F9069E7